MFKTWDIVQVVATGQAGRVRYVGNRPVRVAVAPATPARKGVKASPAKFATRDEPVVGVHLDGTADHQVQEFAPGELKRIGEV
jgi:hypothetical protein